MDESSPWSVGGFHEDAPAQLPAMPSRPAWLEGAAPPPPRLLFRAWFQEEGSTRSSLIRRELALEVHTKTGAFKVRVQGTENEYSLSALFDRQGRALDFLDLHVGAVVDIMGKPTTLGQADLVTSEWIDAEAKFIRSLVDRICGEIRKYGLNPPGSSVVATPFAFRNKSNPAQPCLRQNLVELEKLYVTLEETRPRAAQAWSEWAQMVGRRKLADEASKRHRESDRKLSRRMASVGASQVTATMKA